MTYHRQGKLVMACVRISFRPQGEIGEVFLCHVEGEAGLKVNDQLVAYATRFLAVRLKKYVWSHHRALKAEV